MYFVLNISVLLNIASSVGIHLAMIPKYRGKEAVINTDVVKMDF